MVQNGTLISSPVGGCDADGQGLGLGLGPLSSTTTNHPNVLYQCEQPVSTVVCLRSPLRSTSEDSPGGGATFSTPTSVPTTIFKPTRSPTTMIPSKEPTARPTRRPTGGSAPWMPPSNYGSDDTYTNNNGNVNGNSNGGSNYPSDNTRDSSGGMDGSDEGQQIPQNQYNTTEGSINVAFLSTSLEFYKMSSKILAGDPPFP